MNASSAGYAGAQPERWATLYRITGYAIIAMLIIMPVQIAIFIMFPFPDSIELWYELFHDSWLLGLVHLDLLYIVNNVIVAVMYLALFFSLRERNEGLMVIALLLGLLGISAYLASNKAFEMLSLSTLYHSAASDAAKTIFLAAGQTMISSWKGTAFDVYYILNGISLIIIAGVMFESPIFSRRTAAIGLASGLLMMIPSTAGTLGMVFALASLVPWVIFSALVAVKFLWLGNLQATT